MTKHPVALKRIVKVLNQKITRRPKCLSFFFFRRASSNLCLFHDGFCTKQQHFSLSSVPAHCFFPGLKSHEAIQTAHWRTRISHPLCEHLYYDDSSSDLEDLSQYEKLRLKRIEENHKFMEDNFQERTTSSPLAHPTCKVCTSARCLVM